MAGTITEDTEEFINSVEKRPALYLKSLKEYSDINLKKKLWEEVCMEVVSGWLELDPENKKKRGAEVQQKWLNLRTCFSRELKAQRTTSGQAAKKRRKYRYFEKLLFLKSSLTERPTDGNLDSTVAEDEDETETSDIMGSNVPKQQNKRNKKVTSLPKFEESLLNILKDDLDEDKHFALSLVPTLQSMTDDEKFQAKIEILQVCRRIKANRQHIQSSVTLPSRNILLQPSTTNFIQDTPTNLVHQISQQPGYSAFATTHIDVSRPEYIRQCPSTSSRHSADSVQSFISTFTPSPHSPLLDLN